MFKLTHPAVDIAVVCHNFEESLHFYRDLLGLEVVYEMDVPGDFAQKVGIAPGPFRQVRLAAGETRIKLMDIKTPPPRSPIEFRTGVYWITFIVEDIAATVAGLKARGVQFVSDPQRAPDARGVCAARDPDGLLVEFVQI